tara:strand:+ start:751 stop:1395 length:645 start_codon:yes stop_codon:yes gene_type:complete
MATNDILEITTKCNLACYGCSRTNFPPEKTTDLSLEDIKLSCKVFGPTQDLLIGGDLGDPLMHSKFIEAYNIICKNLIPIDNKSTITIESNSSIRNANFYKKYLDVCKQNQHWKHIYRFSVDGMENSNHIYRVNAKWKKIQEAMDVMFKQNIVSVEWKYILFNHNLNDLFEVYDIIKKYNITLQLSDSYKSSFIPESFFPDIKVQDVEISQMLL